MKKKNMRWRYSNGSPILNQMLTTMNELLQQLQGSRLNEVLVRGELNFTTV